MKIKVLEKPLDFEGKFFLDKGQDGKDVELTWRMIFHTALKTPHSVVETSPNGPYQRIDEIFTSEVKDKIYEVMNKLYSSDEPDFTPSQCTFLLTRVDKIYGSPELYGKTKELIGEIKKEETKPI